MQEDSNLESQEQIKDVIPSEDVQKKIMAEISKEEGEFDWEQSRERNDIFLEDNAQKALEKILRLQELTFNERMVYVKHLAELFALMGDEGFQNIGQIFSSILKDSDEIKKNFLVQIPGICEILNQDHKYIVQLHILPTLILLLNYNNLDVKEEAALQLINISDYLNEEDKQNSIMKQIQLMMNDEQEDNRIVAAQLLGSIAFKERVNPQQLALYLVGLMVDASQRVKRSVLANLPKACTLVPQEFYMKHIYSVFMQQCKVMVWQVRRACAEQIHEFAKLAPETNRALDLSNQMISFLRDQNKWVKASAFLVLGRFIETLVSTTNPSQVILDEYCGMTSSETKGCFNTEVEVLQECAFSFPAVLQTYHSHLPQLLKLLQQLLKYHDPVVRRPIAYALHEIARIIGPQKSERHLIGVMDEILNDRNEDVQCGVIQNLWKFLKVFDMDRREYLLDVFFVLQKKTKKWRVRNLIAMQIENLTHIYSAETVFKIIVPISFKLCNDHVAEVRNRAAKNIFSLLKSFELDPDEMSDVYKQCVMDNLRAFSGSQRFTHRQIYIRMCSNIIKHSEILFEAVLLDTLLALSEDNVVLVRISLAKMVRKSLMRQTHLADNPKFKHIIEILSKDSSQEVKNQIDMLKK